MTRTVRVTCPDCGDIRVQDHEVTLRLCLDTNQGSYRFRCSTCRRFVLKPADTRTFRLLSDTDAPLEQWTLPLELFENRPGGEPISYNDILDLHDELEADDQT